MSTLTEILQRIGRLLAAGLISADECNELSEFARMIPDNGNGVQGWHAMAIRALAAQGTSESAIRKDRVLKILIEHSGPQSDELLKDLIRKKQQETLRQEEQMKVGLTSELLTSAVSELKNIRGAKPSIQLEHLLSPRVFENFPNVVNLLGDAKILSKAEHKALVERYMQCRNGINGDLDFLHYIITAFQGPSTVIKNQMKRGQEIINMLFAKPGKVRELLADKTGAHTTVLQFEHEEPRKPQRIVNHEPQLDCAVQFIDRQIDLQRALQTERATIESQQVPEFIQALTRKSAKSFGAAALSMDSLICCDLCHELCKNASQVAYSTCRECLKSYHLHCLGRVPGSLSQSFVCAPCIEDAITSDDLPEYEREIFSATKDAEEAKITASSFPNLTTHLVLLLKRCMTLNLLTHQEFQTLYAAWGEVLSLRQDKLDKFNHFLLEVIPSLFSDRQRRIHVQGALWDKTNHDAVRSIHTREQTRLKGVIAENTLASAQLREDMDTQNRLSKRVAVNHNLISKVVDLVRLKQELLLKLEKIQKKIIRIVQKIESEHSQRECASNVIIQAATNKGTSTSARGPLENQHPGLVSQFKAMCDTGILKHKECHAMCSHWQEISNPNNQPNIVVSDAMRSSLARFIKTTFGEARGEEILISITRNVPELRGLNANANAQPWHKDTDVVHRKDIYELICSLLEKEMIVGDASNVEFEREIKSKASTIESVLYSDASSLEHYLDRNTLTLRLKWYSGNQEPPRLTNNQDDSPAVELRFAEHAYKVTVGELSKINKELRDSYQALEKNQLEMQQATTQELIRQRRQLQGQEFIPNVMEQSPAVLRFVVANPFCHCKQAPVLSFRPPYHMLSCGTSKRCNFIKAMPLPEDKPEVEVNLVLLQQQQVHQQQQQQQQQQHQQKQQQQQQQKQQKQQQSQQQQARGPMVSGSQAQALSRVQSQTRVKAKADAHAEAQAQARAQAETRADTLAKVISLQTQALADAKSKAHVKHVNQIQVTKTLQLEPHEHSQSHAHAQTQDQANIKPQPQPQAQPQAQLQPQVQLQPQAHVQPQPQPKPKQPTVPIVISSAQQTAESAAIRSDKKQPWLFDNAENTAARKAMVDHITEVLKKRKPDATQDWLEKLPQMAQRLETALYSSANSQNEYINRDTLVARVQQLKQIEIARKKAFIPSQARPVTIASTVAAVTTSFTSSNASTSSDTTTVPSVLGGKRLSPENVVVDSTADDSNSEFDPSKRPRL